MSDLAVVRGPTSTGTRTDYRHCSPVALSTMRHGHGHHPQAFGDRYIDAVCEFRLIVEQRYSFGPTTRVQHVFPPVCSKCPQSLFMQRGIATRMPSHLPNCRYSLVEYA